MPSNDNTLKAANVYRVVQVEKTKAPDGMEGDNWHLYVIGRGNSKIEGKKPGTLNQVTQHANAVAEDLNSRAGSRGSSVYASRQQKK